MASETMPAAGLQKASTDQFERWLNEHHEAILRRWLHKQAAVESSRQPAGGPRSDDLTAGDSPHHALLHSLTNHSAAEQLLGVPSPGDSGPPTAPTTSALKLTTWHALLQDMRQSIVAELQATASSDQAFELLLAADDAINYLAGRLTRSFQQQFDRLIRERNRFQALHATTYEMASNLDLDRIAQSALEGAVKITGADFGVLLILDRESGHLFPWASYGWEVKAVEPDALPDDWTQGWRDVAIKPIGNVAALPPAEWRSALQVPRTASALIIAPTSTSGEFYGLIALASRQANQFIDDDAASVKAIATQLASVIENAEIYRLINHQAQELGHMLRQQQDEASKSQAILESIADGVVVNDPQGRVIMANPAAELILGQPRDSLMGIELRQLIKAFDEPGCATALATVEQFLCSSDVSSQVEAPAVVLEKDSRVINAHMSPVVTPRDEFLGVVTILRDITREVEADRAKSEFVSTVSHELRTPMTAIKGYTDLLVSGSVGPLNNNQEHFLGIIKSNTERLTALINDLLDIARVESGRVRFEPIPVKLGKVVASVVEAMAAHARERGLTLTYEVDAGLPEVLGDYDRLYQVLTNLVGNAINYTPKGSVTVEAINVGTAVQVNVRDTGIGIKAEDVGHIFDRFYRADDPVVQEASGTGLGLPMVKIFVEMHGGRVWVDTEEGQGSTFTFIIPVPGTEAEGEEESTTRVLSLTAAKTVLVVDDDQDIAELVRLQLEDNGYRVLTTGRGRQALEITQKSKIDLIVLDRLLPDVNGLEVLDTLKADPSTAEIPIIFLTIVEDDGEAMERGASAYITKPINEQLFLEQVETALTRQGRVLIVEDDSDTADMLTRALRRVGFSTETAIDGYQALAAARRVRPDVIVLDLRLPGMDGYEALSHLKRSVATSTIPIIAISAHVSNPLVERKRLMMLGATDFLPKPLSIEEMIAIIDRAIEAGRNLSLAAANEGGVE